MNMLSRDEPESKRTGELLEEVHEDCSEELGTVARSQNVLPRVLDSVGGIGSLQDVLGRHVGCMAQVHARVTFPGLIIVVKVRT